MDIHYFDQLESTNQYCKLLDPASVEEFTVVCARSQTAGIGQQGNHWDSEPFRNLTFSIILKPTFLSAADQYRLTMAIAVGVARFVEECLSYPLVSIKWPNDIYINRQKLCGILTTCQVQSSRLTHAICGIGLNVNQTEFPSWVPNPTSLKLLSDTTFKLDPLLESLLQNLQHYYQLLQTRPADIEQAYLQRLYQMGQPADYEYHGQRLRATILGINTFGQLQLHTDDGRSLTCSLKEIKYL